MHILGMPRCLLVFAPEYKAVKMLFLRYEMAILSIPHYKCIMLCRTMPVWEPILRM